MKKNAPQPAVPGGKKKKPYAPLPNAAINAQNRRVMAQHYRAKYGVK